MASSIPDQYRAVDPFASYNSNSVNQLTELITRGDNVLDTPCGLDIESDSTSPLTVVIVKPGYAFKDDVMIVITQDHQVDFEDPDQYISFGAGFNETGYYYIVLEYDYVKSRPAPQAKVKIVKPSQVSHYTYNTSSSSLMFLKAVLISGPPFQIVSFHDYDPSNPSNKREFSKKYAGAVTNLPTHDSCRDKGRIAYDVVTDQFYFGFDDRWELLNVGGTINIDTTGTNVGSLCYVDTNGAASESLGTSGNTTAEMISVEIGLASDGSGQARLSGYVEDVRVESTSPNINVGDLLYLSKTESGTVTSAQPSPLYQVVGKALSNEASSKVNILFFPRDLLETSTVARVATTITSWTASGGSYYADIDISDLGLTSYQKAVVVTCWDNSTDKVISPQDIEATSNTNIRIWMPVNTVNVRVAIVG